MHIVPQGLLCLAAVGLTAIPVQSALAKPAPEPPVLEMAQSTKTVQARFAQHFQDLGIEGSILIHDLNGKRTYEHNANRNAQPFLPASTFKILNSLIALETGVITNDLAQYRTKD